MESSVVDKQGVVIPGPKYGVEEHVFVIGMRKQQCEHCRHYTVNPEKWIVLGRGEITHASVNFVPNPDRHPVLYHVKTDDPHALGFLVPLDTPGSSKAEEEYIFETEEAALAECVRLNAEMDAELSK